MDEIVKSLFNTSHKVLCNLLNGIFDESYDSKDIIIETSNNEFTMSKLDIIRGDMFFNISQQTNKKVGYHLEFQTQNDSTMVIRMFEYAFKKSSELSIKNEEIQRIKFPKQKVIFIEKNRNIPDILKLNIELPEL